MKKIDNGWQNDERQGDCSVLSGKLTRVICSIALIFFQQ